MIIAPGVLSAYSGIAEDLELKQGFSSQDERAVEDTASESTIGPSSTHLDSTCNKAGNTVGETTCTELVNAVGELTYEELCSNKQDIGSTGKELIVCSKSASGFVSMTME